MYHNDEWYQPVFDAPSTHIVKQSHVRLDSIVLNEQLSLMTAKEMGLDIADSFIIDVGIGRDEDILFASKRYDRLVGSYPIRLSGNRKSVMVWYCHISPACPEAVLHIKFHLGKLRTSFAVRGRWLYELAMRFELHHYDSYDENDGAL